MTVKIFFVYFALTNHSKLPNYFPEERSKKLRLSRRRKSENALFVLKLLSDDRFEGGESKISFYLPFFLALLS